MKAKVPKSGRFKQFKIVLMILLIFIVGEQIPSVQRITAISASQLYVFAEYGNDLSFDHIEYQSHFGNYFVTYENKNGEMLSFVVTPKFFPVLVTYDPIKKEANARRFSTIPGRAETRL